MEHIPEKRQSVRPPVTVVLAALVLLAALAGKAGVRAVALGDILYHAPEARLLQDLVTAIREKCTVDTHGDRRERHAVRDLNCC